MTDGVIHITSISSDVLAAIFNSLHETLHREGTVGSLDAAERALYDSVVAELTARSNDANRGEKK